MLVKFLSVVWLSKTKVSPDVIIDIVLVFSVTMTLKQLQEFWGILRYWRSFILHIVQLLNVIGVEQNKKPFNR